MLVNSVEIDFSKASFTKDGIKSEKVSPVFNFYFDNLTITVDLFMSREEFEIGIDEMIDVSEYIMSIIMIDSGGMIGLDSSNAVINIKRLSDAVYNFSFLLGDISFNKDFSI